MPVFKSLKTSPPEFRQTLHRTEDEIIAKPAWKRQVGKGMLDDVIDAMVLALTARHGTQNGFRVLGGGTDEEVLIQPPYVGPYAANATLCFAFDKQRLVEDTNVMRIYNRGFGVDFNPQDDQAWVLADRMLPDDDCQRFNLALIDFGAKICTADSPHCQECFFAISVTTSRRRPNHKRVRGGTCKRPFEVTVNIR